ncbi:unnamed protein product [Chilo suppressalis]|uniref:DUF233 protein n=1 Tax=Chilo suppressalis TaxID=168631 RepID=A0ABN8AUM2_CHISP|nr:unnamed protein product [Chilo suppressalis]
MCKTVIIFTAILYLSYAKIAPNYIVPCPGLKSDCLKSNIQQVIPEFVNGVPSIGIEVLDPLQQNNVDLSLPGGLNINFTNGTVTGLRQCVIESAAYKINEAVMNFHCDLTVSGIYKANGKILFFSINGDGEAQIKTSNMTMKATLFFEDQTRDGKVYYVVKKTSFDYKYGGRVTFNITNLIKSSPNLSEAVLLFLNENWKAVTKEFGGPIVDEIFNSVIKNIKKFFSNIPKDELFLDTGI